MYKVVLFLLFVLFGEIAEAQPSWCKKYENYPKRERKETIKGIEYVITDINFDDNHHNLWEERFVYRGNQLDYDSIPVLHEAFPVHVRAKVILDSLIRKTLLPILKQKQISPSSKGNFFVEIVLDGRNGRKVVHLGLRARGVFKDQIPLEVYHVLDERIRKSDILNIVKKQVIPAELPTTIMVVLYGYYWSPQKIYNLEK